MGRHFVLIHGVWHGGWCWDGVIRRLENAGHTAEAPTIPGNNPGDDRASVTFAAYVDAIDAVLKRQREPVILVGHSSAGFLLQAVAPRAAEKIAHLVFHNAFILPDGTSLLDLIPPDAAQGLAAAADASPDKSVPVLETFVRSVLMAGDPPEAQDALLRRLVPQPFAIFTTKVHTALFFVLDIPRTVLFCTGDQSLPPGGYLNMARSLGTYSLIEREGSHETLFVHPKVVADALIAIADGVE